MFSPPEDQWDGTRANTRGEELRHHTCLFPIPTAHVRPRDFQADLETRAVPREIHPRGPGFQDPFLVLRGPASKIPSRPRKTQSGPWVNFVQPSFAEQRTHFGLW